jgi:hypothetical protein
MPVMPGLDPGIHAEVPPAPAVRMDCRVKPGNDDVFQSRLKRNGAGNSRAVVFAVADSLSICGRAGAPE